MISTHSRFARRGFSLIEVAIALVIFVIGALAIIRIFPGALKVIGNNGNQQIASNLNSSVATSIKTESSVPDANFNVGVNADGSLRWTTANNTDHTTDYADDPTSVIGVPRINATLPTTQEINTQTNNSALARYRGILGEQSKVFQIGTDPNAPRFATTQFPISLSNGVTADILLAPTISQEYLVRGARIDTRRQVTFNNATVVGTDGMEYRLDDNSPRAVAAKVAALRTVPAGSMLYISYRYYGNSRIWGVREEAVPVKADSDLLNQQTPVVVMPPFQKRDAMNGGTLAEVVDVRVKRLVGAGVFPGATDVDKATAARCGLVQLPAAVSTDTVSIDYVADWSWLLQKGTPSIAPDETPVTAPAANRTYRQIALGVPFVEDQATVGIYSALLEPVPNSNPATNTLSVSRFGTENSAPVAASGALLTPTPDDLKTGRVTFSVANSASKARVAYRTRDSWAQQLSVSASAYKPHVPVTAEPWRDYVLGDDNYLYFHAGEAGKTINVTYAVNVNGNSVPIIERPFVISSQIIDAGALVPTTFSTGKISRVLLTDVNNGPLAIPDLISIQGVRGVSFSVRTAYINGNRYAQTLLTSNRGTN